MMTSSPATEPSAFQISVLFDTFFIIPENHPGECGFQRRSDSLAAGSLRHTSSRHERRLQGGSGEENRSRSGRQNPRDQITAREQ